MKKLLLVVLLMFLAACEQAVVEEVNIVPEVVESVEEDSVNKEKIIESKPVDVELFLSSFDSVEEWLIDRLLQRSDEQYVDYRFLDNNQNFVIFSNGHQIKVPSSVTEPWKVTVLEDLELVGQSLSRLPHLILNQIDEVNLVDGNTPLSLTRGRVRVGHLTLISIIESNSSNHPLILNFIKQTNEQISLSMPNDFEQFNDQIMTLSSRSQLGTLEAFLELYWLRVMSENELLLDEEELKINETLNSSFEAVSIVESIVLFEDKTFDSSILPPHVSPNINSSRFYSLFTKESPSSLTHLTYQGEDVRYYERLILPDGCTRPEQCPASMNWSVSSPYDVHVFVAHFKNNESIEFNVNNNVNAERAEELIEPFAVIYGQMPQILLQGLRGFILIDGEGGVWGGPYHGYFTTLFNCGSCDIYEFKGLPELILHELVHSSLDEGIRRPDHLTGTGRVDSLGLIEAIEWKNAASKDNVFISHYAAEQPNREDIAETILVYIASRYYTDRLGPTTADALRRLLPHRFELLDKVFDMQE